MSRTVRDARLSLSRYMAETLPDKYEAWLARQEPEVERPFFVVRTVGDQQTRSQGRMIQDITRPFFVHIYPPVAKTPLDAQEAVDELEVLLSDAFVAGVGRGYAHRVPLYDYAGVQLDDPNVPDDPEGYLRLAREGFQLRSLPDDMDERRWNITVSLRLSWRRLGTPRSGPVVRTVIVRPAP